MDDVASSGGESHPHASKDSEGRQGDTATNNLWKSSPSSDTTSTEVGVFFKGVHF